MYMYCLPVSYVVNSFPLANIRIIGSRSKRKSRLLGASGLVYVFKYLHSILYTCRRLTYESHRRAALSARSRVGYLFLAFFEFASGWSGVGYMGRYHDRRLAWNSLFLLYISWSFFPWKDVISLRLAHTCRLSRNINVRDESGPCSSLRLASK